MDKSTLIEMLEEILETEEGVLSEETVLEDLEEWDSLGKLSLMAMAKKECDKSLTATEIREFVTVNDICNALL